MKRPVFLPLFLCLLLTACGNRTPSDNIPKTSANAPPETTAGPVELCVFAAASMTETLDQVIALYKDQAPDVTVTPTYDSSGTLLQQIQEGAVCDLFISAAPKQMDVLSDEGALLQNSRRDLLENKIVLAVPEGNPKAVGTFDQLAETLKSGGVLLAIGNSDVPAGQYARKIFAFYNLDETALAASGVLTYGSNVKEVTTQVSEAVVDCGIIYATDAFSANLSVTDEAVPAMCGQVLYPAAVLEQTLYPDEARAFLDFLSSDAANAVFEDAGFSPLS